MPFRQRVARRLGDAVSSNSNSTTAFDTPRPPITPPPSDRENDEQQVQERKRTESTGSKEATSKRGTTGQSAHRGSGGVEAAAKRTKQSDQVLAEPSSNKVTKRTGGACDRAKKPYKKKIYQKVARATRSSTRLTDQLSPDSKPYLSYYDIQLSHEDVRSLKSDWLNDSNIAFWEEWLDREILPKYPQARIVLLRPTMTFLLMKAQDFKSVKDALPNLDKVTHIFLPICDNRDVGSEGGSHWSLLLVSTIDGVAFHYDSLGGANNSEARQCTLRLSRVLGKPLRFQALDDCPQQENGSDCGVFVCIIMRHLLVKRLLNANAKEKVSMSMANKAIDSYGGRKEMLRIVDSLRKEAERRRSLSPFPGSSSTPPRIE